MTSRTTVGPVRVRYGVDVVTGIYADLTGSIRVPDRVLHSAGVRLGGARRGRALAHARRAQPARSAGRRVRRRLGGPVRAPIGDALDFPIPGRRILLAARWVFPEPKAGASVAQPQMSQTTSAPPASRHARSARSPADLRCRRRRRHRRSGRRRDPRADPVVPERRARQRDGPHPARPERRAGREGRRRRSRRADDGADVEAPRLQRPRRAGAGRPGSPDRHRPRGPARRPREALGRAARTTSTAAASTRRS